MIQSDLEAHHRKVKAKTPVDSSVTVVFAAMALTDQNCNENSEQLMVWTPRWSNLRACALKTTIFNLKTTTLCPNKEQHLKIELKSSINNY